MALSIKHKTLLPVILLAILTSLLAGGSLLTLRKLTKLNTTLVHRYHEIEEVREIGQTLDSLIYPHLEFITHGHLRSQTQSRAVAQQFISHAQQCIDKLRKMDIVDGEELEMVRFLQTHLDRVRHDSSAIFTGTTSSHKSMMIRLDRLAKDHLLPIRNKLKEWATHELNEVEENKEESVTLLDNFLIWVVLSFVSVLSLIAYSIWIYSRVLVRPILSISRVTSRLAAGEFNHKIDIHSEDEIGKLAENINAMTDSLNGMQTELREIANTDQLTNLLNRRTMDEILAHELAYAERNKLNLSLVLLDIDNFKNINDSFGHPTGDQVLQRFAALCSDTLRREDYLFRYGGEEFLLLLTGLSEAAASSAVERLRHLIESTPVSVGEIEINMTASFGLAVFPTDADDDKKLLDHADMALYAAKERGKNCLVSYSSL